MLQVVGNLSERGMAFFLDRELRYEIVQDSNVVIGEGNSYEFFIGVKHRYDANARWGRILSLEENYTAFMIDMIEEVQGEEFRNYDNIENIEMEVEFDSHAFMKNLLIGLLDRQFYHVLQFISMPHMGKNDECFYICSCEPDRIEIVPCNYDCGLEIPKWQFKPTGWWGIEEIPPNGYYNFLTDFFMEQGGEDRESIFDQFMYNIDITRMLTHKYMNDGYPSYSSTRENVSIPFHSYNYVNNIYPEQTEILDNRWKYGGYDVTWLEYRLKKTAVYRTLSKWYVAGQGYTNEKSYLFEADEMTVKGHTDIAKTDTRAIFERDEHILEELLGPKECVSWDNYGNCAKYRYGNVNYDDGYNDDVETIIIGIANDELEAKLWPPNELPEHNFMVIYDRYFESLSESYINGEEFKSLSMGTRGIPPKDAFYSIEHSNGKIGGQYVYNNGMGNEHRYFMKFRDFLSDQGWTLDEFMSWYAGPISDRIAEIEGAVINTKSTMRVKDFSEFYDKYHKAPFDNIKHYVPMIPTFGNYGTTTKTTIRKRKVIVDQNGTETIVDAGEEILYNGDFKASINKDEFVYEVMTSNSVKILLSDYMRIRVKISLNTLYPTTNTVKLRVSATDFTYLNMREFEYHE